MHLNISFKHITKVFVDYKLNFVQYEINDYFCLVLGFFCKMRQKVKKSVIMKACDPGKLSS